MAGAGGGQFQEFSRWAEGGAQARELPALLEEHRTRVTCGAEHNAHVNLPQSAHVYSALGVSNSQSVGEFKEGFDIRITRLGEEVMEFEMVGASPALANAVRRTLLSEVPTMAIEHVFFRNNTSIIHDEILAHRLGLVPLRANPRLFQFREEGDVSTQDNTIVLRLRAACARREDGSLEGERVLSGDLEWLPAGSEMQDETSVVFSENQEDRLKRMGDAAGVAPVHEDILLAKLRPGQEIDLEAHCVKGTGDEHAKWSPVATAWYRLCPQVVLAREVAGDRADQLVARFPADKCPFAVEGEGGSRRAVVKEPRGFQETNELVRALSGEEEWRDTVKLQKVKNHFLFTIESTGILPPWELFRDALHVLREKCEINLRNLQDQMDTG